MDTKVAEIPTKIKPITIDKVKVPEEKQEEIDIVVKMQKDFIPATMMIACEVDVLYKLPVGIFTLHINDLVVHAMASGIIFKDYKLVASKAGRSAIVSKNSDDYNMSKFTFCPAGHIRVVDDLLLYCNDQGKLAIGPLDGKRWINFEWCIDKSNNRIYNRHRKLFL